MLKKIFSEAQLVDRRTKPGFGYRAAHVIVSISGKPIEVQVRSSLQHLRAEFSEKLSDIEDPGIKYGGGPKYIQDMLSTFSELVARFEKNESNIAALKDAQEPTHLLTLQRELQKLREDIATLLQNYI